MFKNPWVAAFTAIVVFYLAIGFVSGRWNPFSKA